jgi:hypothetical protein
MAERAVDRFPDAADDRGVGDIAHLDLHRVLDGSHGGRLRSGHQRE